MARRGGHIPLPAMLPAGEPWLGRLLCYHRRLLQRRETRSNPAALTGNQVELAWCDAHQDGTEAHHVRSHIARAADAS